MNMNLRLKIVQKFSVTTYYTEFSLGNVWIGTLPRIFSGYSPCSGHYQELFRMIRLYQNIIEKISVSFQNPTTVIKKPYTVEVQGISYKA
jgi:hypothetical protein